MKQSDLEALLGRPLTPGELANRELYLQIARESLEELLCINLCDNDTGTRVFDIREGYRTVFTDVFTELSKVEVDGQEVTDYTPAFWDRRTNAFYNSIVLDEPKGTKVALTGFWGFNKTPADLKRLWAIAFSDTAQKYTSGEAGVKSKRVEDFDITYGNLSDDDMFIRNNARVISKYQMCNAGYTVSGATGGCYDCL